MGVELHAKGAKAGAEALNICLVVSPSLVLGASDLGLIRIVTIVL